MTFADVGADPVRLARVDVFLKLLELEREPFVRVVDASFQLNIRGSTVTMPMEPMPIFPPWVDASYDAALDAEHIEYQGTNADGNVNEVGVIGFTRVGLPLRPVWRQFLVLCSLDPVMSGAIETVYRLDGKKGAAYAFDRWSLFLDKITKETPVVARVERLQTRRQRRLEGRAVRPADADYAAEVRTLRVPRKESERHRKR